MAPSQTVVAWSAAQAQTAGVKTQTVGLTGAGAAAGLVLQGTVELPPQATELLSTPVAGVVQKVLVGAGQKVKAGEPVALLLSPELVTWQRELLQAQAQARLAVSKLERDEKLHAEGIIAGLRLQETRTQNELAELAVRERRQTLQMAGANMAGDSLQPGLTLRASAAGTVLEVSASPGQRLDAGMPVAKIARSGKLAIALQATPEQTQSLRTGDLLAVQGCKTPARLSAIVPQVSAGNQAVQLRADFTSNEDCLRVNQFVQVTVAERTDAQVARSVSVPAAAVVRHEGQAYMFVQTAKGFVPTAVVLGTEGTGQTLVRSGVKAGDVIAVQGLAALKGAWQGMGSGAQ
jgi:RND family efflux transporter MFP subunit